jgi:hypothetical protein
MGKSNYWYSKAKGQKVAYHTSKPKIARLNVDKRHFAATMRDEVEIDELIKELTFVDGELKKQKQKLIDLGSHQEINDLIAGLKEYQFEIIQTIDKLESVNPDINKPVERTVSKHRRIESFTPSVIKVYLFYHRFYLINLI